MADYQGLRYRTRGNASPQGRPHVYFCCHPEDFNRYFDTVAGEVLDIQKNAAIWYHDPEENVSGCEDFLADLEQMQLFVIPVTARFIYSENNARQVEFAYALKHHIPVLPLMQETGLEDDFNRICGNLQSLNRNANDADPTALPYDEKLERFLNSVLVSDELAERIRAAFDAYIFLSYRKKDRRYARQLMRLIHENDFCRDVAIWYDEFLTPGEDFNDAIAAALEKCSLFALTVTPSLLEKPNYVMTTEYPDAVRLGKPVLPLEMVETDRNTLGDCYEGIGEVASAGDGKAVSERLSAALRDVALASSDDPRHMFFIGLAYLSGIDVEVDHERALALIEDAAERDLPEAYEKLVSMYNTGEGVERNYQTAIRWQEKYVSMLERTYDSVETETGLVKALMALGDMWNAVGRTDDARDAFTRMQAHAERVAEKDTSPISVRNVYVSYWKQGLMCRSEGKLQDAEKWYGKGNEICARLARETKRVGVYRDLATSYQLSGEIYQAEGRLEEAGEWFGKGIGILEQIAEQEEGGRIRSDLVISYSMMGDICLNDGILQDAWEWYGKARSICEALVEETGSAGSRASLAICLENMGKAVELQGRLAEARSFYEKSLELRKSLADETGTMDSAEALAKTYFSLGNVSKLEKKHSEAYEWYSSSLETFERLAMTAETVENRRSIAVICNSLATVCNLEGRLDEAENWCNRCIEISESLAGEVQTVAARRDVALSHLLLGEIHEASERYADASECYRRALPMLEQLADDTQTPESLQDLASAYVKLGIMCQREEKTQDAAGAFSKSLDIYRTVARETGAVNARRRISLCCIKLGETFRKEGKFRDAERFFLESIENSEHLVKETSDVGSRSYLSFACKCLGEVYQADRKPLKASTMYRKGLFIAEDLAGELGTVGAYEDLAYYYVKLATLGNKAMYGKAYEIYSRLAVKCPGVERYRKMLESLRPYVK